VLGAQNAKPVAPKLVIVLFRGTAKFFAGFAKGDSPSTLWWGRNRGAVRFRNQLQKKRKAERTQVPGATDVG
jgi:hypothetical protein